MLGVDASNSVGSGPNEILERYWNTILCSVQVKIKCKIKILTSWVRSEGLTRFIGWWAIV